jgi:hypothetical protein
VRVFLEDGEMRPGEDLAAKARQGRMADMVVVLFSRESLPPRWPRSQWEDALVKEPAEEGVRIAFLRCDDCVPPKVLAPQFESKQLRELKRWVRNRAAEWQPPEEVCGEESAGSLEVLGIAIADCPGVETVNDTGLAFDFVRAFREDFDEVLYVDCGERSTAALAGDLGVQLGMRLEGRVPENLERLREFCAARRMLVLLDDLRDRESHPLVFGGRCSTLISTGCNPERKRSELEEIQSALSQPRRDWDEVCQMVRQGRRITREQGRIAECFELMRQWNEAAEEREDRKALEESAREMVWILESWGMQEEAARLEYRRATEYADQMALF